MEISITIPVFKHVKKYLDKNPHLLHPGELSDSDPAGKFLLAVMSRPTQKEAKDLRLNEKLILQVNKHYQKQRHAKNDVCHYNAKRFNLWIQSLIKSEFINFVENALMINDKVKVDRVIRMFEDKYNLHDTCMNFSTLKRSWHRHRFKKKISAKMTSSNN